MKNLDEISKNQNAMKSLWAYLEDQNHFTFIGLRDNEWDVALMFDLDSYLGERLGCSEVHFEMTEQWLADHIGVVQSAPAYKAPSMALSVDDHEYVGQRELSLAEAIDNELDKTWEVEERLSSWLEDCIQSGNLEGIRVKGTK